MNPIKAFQDKKLLGQFLSDPETWRAWFTFLRAFFALPAIKGDIKLYKQCTERSKWPSEPAKEAWLIIGTRGGKSFITALIATYISVFQKHSLSTGERGYVLIVAPTKKQSGIIKRYLSSFFHDNPFLSPFLVRETNEEIELSNHIIIATLSSDYRSLRGFTGIAAIVDEVAFLSIEGQKPDTEVVRALRSRLLTTQGPLICISSPYAKRGMLYEVYKKHYGQNSNILVWQGHSKLMNPTLSDTMIAEMLAEDATGAFADLGLGFRSDIETFLLREVVENLIVPERFELAPVHGIQYVAFADPSGGSQDSMTLGIAHREGDALVLDLLRESRPPFSPDQVVQQFAETLKQYGLTTVTGDKYGGLWPSERFQVHGIDYQVSKLSKSDLYRELLPLMNSGQVELLDHERLVNQLINLERRVARGGKDSIDHPRGGRDDLANVCAGALTLLAGKRDAGPVFIGLLDPISMKIESTTSATEHETTGRRQPRRI